MQKVGFFTQKYRIFALQIIKSIEYRSCKRALIGYMKESFVQIFEQILHRFCLQITEYQ